MSDSVTYRDLVREYFPGADDDICDFILWEKTPFPVCDVEELRFRLEMLVREELGQVKK